MKQFLAEIFIWWHGQTLGTRLTAALFFRPVGTDLFGNRYYLEKGGRGRRWVLYNGPAEATQIPPGWHGWMHYRTDQIPTDADQVYAWEKPHIPNQTGTNFAYRPDGSLLTRGERPRVTGDYEAWSPE